MKHVLATIVSIDLNPEFGDITGTEATATVIWFDESQGRSKTKVLSLTKDEAAKRSVGDTQPILSN